MPIHRGWLKQVVSTTPKGDQWVLWNAIIELGERVCAMLHGFTNVDQDLFTTNVGFFSK
jgi:hypothetical protein